MRYVLIALALVLAGPAIGQLTPEEAAQKLEQRKKERQAERAKLTSISQGALEDMQAELIRLRAEVASLKQQLLVARGGPASPVAKANRRPPRTIEVGMTREELMAYLNTHHEYKMVAQHVETPAGRSIHQTTVRRTEAAEASATGNGAVGPDGTRLASNGNQLVTQQQAARGAVTESVENSQGGSKIEHMTLRTFRTISVSVGSHKNVLGGYTEDFENRSIPAGSLEVTLTDDVISAIDARG